MGHNVAHTRCMLENKATFSYAYAHAAVYPHACMHTQTNK
jgi:hypothetical protein